MLDLIIVELKRKKLRTILTILEVVIAITLLVTIASFSEGISENLNKNLEYLSGKIIVIQGGINFATYKLSELDEDLVDEISRINGVEEIAKIRMTTIPKLGSIVAIDYGHDEMFASNVVGCERGRHIEEGEKAIALGKTLAKNLNLDVGDYVNIRGKKYEVTCIYYEQRNENDNTAFTYLENLEEMTGKKGVVTMFMIRPSDINKAEEIAEEISSRINGIYATTDKNAKRSAGNFLNQMRMTTYFIGSIAMIVAGIGIMNVMMMSVRERRRQIGIMKAIGATNFQILRQILIESISISLIGWIIALIISFLIVSQINAIVGMEIAKINSFLLFFSILFAIILGTIGGISPAYKAIKIQPTEALRYE